MQQLNNVNNVQPVFPLALARWPMASENCRRTSDFLAWIG